MESETHQVQAPSETVRALIVIPTFNNRGTLRQVVEEALRTGLEVLVVNDGSTDGGPRTLAGLPVARLDSPVNQGKGAAILAAAQWAEKKEYTHMITIDADGQHEPREAARLLEIIRRHPWSIVTGARDFSRAKAPAASRFGRHFSNFWLRLASGASLPDSQSGFRAYPLAALRRLRCAGRHYDFEVEVLVRAAWAGLKLESVAISTQYFPERERVSHFRPILDNARIAKIYARSVIRHLLPWPHKRLAAAQNAGERLSVRHPWRSLRILVHENTPPREIALAAMLGIFLATLPLIACHSVFIIFFATRLKLNRLVAFNVQHLCAPPLVPALAIETGYYLRHGHFLTQISIQTLGHEIHQRLLDYAIGATALAPLFAVVIGAMAYVVALAYRRIEGKSGG